MMNMKFLAVVTPPSIHQNQLHRQPLKMKMSFPGRSISNFSSQFCPTLPPQCSIPSSQAGNKREFSLSGTYISACSSRLSVDMISSLLLINRYYRVTQPEICIDLFNISTDRIQDQMSDMGISIDCSNKSNSEDKKNPQ